MGNHRYHRRPKVRASGVRLEPAISADSCPSFLIQPATAAPIAPSVTARVPIRLSEPHGAVQEAIAYKAAHTLCNARLLR